ARLSLADGWSTEAELLPAPSTTTVEVPPGRGRRLGIDAADCTPLADRDNVCFAFRIVSPTAQRTELFDPVEDPLEQEDLAGTDAEAAAAIELRDTLLEIQHQPLGARLQRALGDDLTQT